MMPDMQRRVDTWSNTEGHALLLRLIISLHLLMLLNSVPL